MTDRFSINRFWRMLSHDYSLNMASWIGMPLAAFSAILCGETGVLMSGGGINVSSFVDTFSIVLTMFFILSMVIMGTFMFDKMSSRYGQISYLTLPATNLEKYLVNWLETIVATIVSFLVGMVLADAVRAGFCTVIMERPMFHTIILPQVFADKVLPMGVIALWLQSVAMLGSVLWRQKTMVKSIALIFIVATVAFFIADSTHLSLAATNVILAPLTVVNYVLTYRKFVKIQLK